MEFTRSRREIKWEAEESYDEIFTDGIGALELRNVRREGRGFKIANLSIISLPRLF